MFFLNPNKQLYLKGWDGGMFWPPGRVQKLRYYIWLSEIYKNCRELPEIIFNLDFLQIQMSIWVDFWMGWKITGFPGVLQVLCKCPAPAHQSLIDMIYNISFLITGRIRLGIGTVTLHALTPQGCRRIWCYNVLFEAQYDMIFGRRPIGTFADGSLKCPKLAKIGSNVGPCAKIGYTFWQNKNWRDWGFRGCC